MLNRWIPDVEELKVLVEKSQAIKEYPDMKKRAAEAVRKEEDLRAIQPTAIVVHVIVELRKPVRKRNFTQDELRWGLPAKIQALIKKEARIQRADELKSMARWR